MSESFFIDNKVRKRVVLTKNYVLNSNNNSPKLLEKCELTLEKADLSDVMQVRLMDSTNRNIMYICTIDSYMYEQIKTEQSLHVSFQDFIVHLTKILEGCHKNELLMSLIEDDHRILLQFFERRSFRNLIHLYLIMKEAPIETILYHINTSFITIQEELKSTKNQNSCLQNEIQRRELQFDQAKSEIKRLNDAITEQEQLVFSRNCEEINTLQQTIKHLHDNKAKEEQKYKTLATQQHEQNEIIKKENMLLTEKITQEKISSNIFREEINSYKINNSNLRERNDRLQSELISIQNREKKQETVILENRRIIQDLTDKIKSYEKHISNIETDLEAKKKVTATKHNALQVATEEIAKANEIIRKQTKEINDLRKDIDIRNEVALKQENYVKEKEYENGLLMKKMKQLQEKFHNNWKEHRELAVIIRGIEDNANEMEIKYKQRIEELHNKIVGTSNSKSSAYSNDKHKLFTISNGI